MENDNTDNIDLSVLQDILSEIRDINKKVDELSNEEEELEPDTEVFNGFTEDYFQSQQEYQQFVVDSQKINITLSICLFVFLLFFIGAYFARNIFRKL